MRSLNDWWRRRREIIRKRSGATRRPDARAQEHAGHQGAGTGDPRAGAGVALDGAVMALAVEGEAGEYGHWSRIAMRGFEIVTMRMHGAAVSR